jgi:hypothetical protein
LSKVSGLAGEKVRPPQNDTQTRSTIGTTTTPSIHAAAGTASQ